MTDRLARRVDSIRRFLGDLQVDGILITHAPNVSYLTGFTGDSSALLVGGDRVLIVSDFRFETQLRDECPGLERHIRPSSRTLAEELGDVLKTIGWSAAGFESASLSVADWDTIRGRCGSVALRSTAGVVEQGRAIKDAEEIEAIRRAVAIAERAIDRALPGWTGDLDEARAADRLEIALREEGAAGSAFPVIVAAGTRSALPHARPTEGVRLDSGEFVLVDWGACLTPLPYRSDLTRAFPTGKLSPKFTEVYGIVLEAQRRAVDAIRPGVSAGEVDAKARGFIEESGFGAFFDHGLGHGIGLEIHESPRLRGGSSEELRPGMIVTIEPGIYLPDWGGIRIEDDVLVTPDGHERLSRRPSGDLDTLRAVSTAG